MKEETCCQRYGSEFAGLKWTLNYENPHEFYMCQWQNKDNKRVHPAYVIYRVFFAISCVLICFNSYLYGMGYNRPFEFKIKWFIYVTNWTFVMIALQGILGALVVLRKYMEKGNNKDNMHSRLCALYWIFHGIATDVSPNVSIIYWGFVHDPKIYELSFPNISVHLLNTIIVVVDFMMVAFPVRLVHVYWSWLYSLVYLTFNILYTISGGTDWFGNPFIYPILDWNNDLGTAMIWGGAVFVLVSIFRSLFFGLFLLREKMYNYFYKSNKVLPMP